MLLSRRTHTVILSAAKDLTRDINAMWHWRSMPDPSEYLRMTLRLLSDVAPRLSLGHQFLSSTLVFCR
jgi:hypothetical protein